MLSPHLAIQCVNPDDAQLAPYSHKKIEWQCDQGHTWFATPASRTQRGSGCPYCSGRLPILGVNDLATTHPEIAHQLVDSSLGTTLKSGSSKKVLWRCPNNPDHVWEAVVRYRTEKNNTCPHCTPKPKRSTKRLATVAEARPDLLKLTHEKERLASCSLGSGVSIEWVCTDCTPNHPYIMEVRKKIKGQECPIKTHRQVLPGFSDLATTHPEYAQYLRNPNEATEVTYGSDRTLQWVCSTYDHHVFSAKVYQVTRNPVFMCQICAMQGKSSQEKECADVLETLIPDANIVRHARGVIPGVTEIDIWLPDYQLGIEFNGLYWHSEHFKDSNYHAQKTALVRASGADLIHIWADQWVSHKDCVVRMLAHRLHAKEHLPQALNVSMDIDTHTAYARTLEASRISAFDAYEFLDTYHLQGRVVSTYHFALRNEGRIYAVLSVRSPHNNARLGHHEGRWTIQRYATACSVPGGFSKLLAYAENYIHQQGHTLTEWVTFSSNDVSAGDLYAATGFVHDGDVPADYWYSGGFVDLHNQRASKENFQKKRFRTDPNLVFENHWTEHEAALANGLYRIYDAGKKRWIKKVV